MQTPLEPQAILSAMITPAVLISACGSLIIATVNRLTRAVDRTRETFASFAALAQGSGEAEVVTDDEDAELSMLFMQLDLGIRRSRMLQRALAGLYWALGMFVATSVAIGIVAVSGHEYAWAPISLGLIGAALLLLASLLLVHESRIALTSLEAEMDFLWQRGRSRASRDLLDRYRAPKWMFFRPKGQGK